MSDSDSIVQLDTLNHAFSAVLEISRPICNEYMVRQMAERGPFVTYNELQVKFCADCGLSEPLDDPYNHEPTCLWRMAKALYP